MQIKNTTLPKMSFAVSPPSSPHTRIPDITSLVSRNIGRLTALKTAGKYVAPTFPRPINSQELTAILELSDNGADFATLLSNRGFTANLSDIEFSEKLSLKALQQKNLTFARCKFNSSHLSESKILNCDFEKCEFSKGEVEYLGLAADLL